MIPGLKADLHLHTAESGRVVSYNLAQRFGTKECYTKPEDVYARAKEEVDLLAITNHNSIEDALRLADKHPDDVIVGCEYNVKGSAVGHALEVVALDLDEKIHTELSKLRLESLSGFIDMLKKENKPYFMAHPGWRVNRELDLTPELLDSWIPYFPIIETLNGTLQRENEFAQILAYLHNKTESGGSDSHTLNGVGLTWTVADEATNKKEFLQEMLKGNVHPGGQGGHFSKFKRTVRDLTYAFYEEEINRILNEGFFKLIKGSKLSDWKRYFLLATAFPLISILPHTESRHYQIAQEKETLKFEDIYFVHKIKELKSLYPTAQDPQRRKGFEMLIRAKKLKKSTRYYVNDLGPIERVINRLLKNRLAITEGFFRNIEPPTNFDD